MKAEDIVLGLSILLLIGSITFVIIEANKVPPLHFDQAKIKQYENRLHQNF